MGKPPRTPRPDKTNEALLDLAETLLDEMFIDPDNQDAYEKARRARRGAPRKIVEWEMSDDGVVRIFAQPGTPVLSIHLQHDKFQAEVSAQYEIETAIISEAQVVAFTGDRKKAAKVADQWFDEQADLDLDDDMTEELLKLMMGDAADGLESDGDNDDDSEDPGEPPQPTAEDAAVVKKLATKLARLMKRRDPDMMEIADDMMQLEERPQALWPILDALVDACAAKKRDSAMVDAWRFLFASHLTMIRYRIDRGWPWAARMAEQCQARLIEIGEEGRIPSEDFTALIGAFGEARIDMTADTKAALANAGMDLGEEVTEDDLRDVMTRVLSQMAETVSDPFDVCEGLGDAVRAMPAEVRSFMAHEFALSPHMVLRDAVPLLLLAEDQEVRRSAAAALEQIAAPDTMSPETLRRMIAIRNWIPLADRAPLDQAIRKARLKGVACAQWPQPIELAISASTIDGAGACSIVVSSRGTGKGMIAGMLLKLASGVVDSWCHVDMPRREINRMLERVREATEASEVGRDFLDVMVQHVIATGTAAGQPPSVVLLRIAELAGGSDWQDRRVDIAAEAEALVNALPGPKRTPSAIGASLKRSGGWIGKPGFSESWFLDDADTRAELADARKNKDPDPGGRLLANVMPKHRAQWAERFLLLAVRAASAKDKTQHDAAGDYAILAHVLCGDRALETIPIMRAIVDHTTLIGRLSRRG